MKNHLVSSLVIVIAALTTGQAFAQAATAPNTPRVDRREASQQTRIDQGVRSGELTSKEAARLNAQQARINANEAAAKSDGKVTRAERRSLAKQQNRASRKVYRAKHNQRKA
jgi:hypothetical protein